MRIMSVDELNWPLDLVPMWLFQNSQSRLQILTFWYKTRAQFHRAAHSTKSSSAQQIMLTRAGIPAKLPCHMYNLWLASCSFLLSRKLFSNIFCLGGSMKLGPGLFFIKHTKAFLDISFPAGWCSGICWLCLLPLVCCFYFCGSLPPPLLSASS